MNENKSNSELLFYSSDDGKSKIEVRLENETVWLSQAQMVELFQTTKQNVSLHIKNVFAEGELEENSVVKEYLTTASDGKRYKTTYYNLDVIISVGKGWKRGQTHLLFIRRGDRLDFRSFPRKKKEEPVAIDKL